MTRTDRLETGGYLFSRPTRARDKQIEILHATSTGHAERTNGSILLDSGEWARAERAFRGDGFDFSMCGVWHCHPGSRSTAPSDVDLRGWLTALDWHAEHGRSAAFSVGLIYIASFDSWRNEESWGSPQVSAWVVHREGYSQRPVCEPCHVRERR